MPFYPSVISAGKVIETELEGLKHAADQKNISLTTRLNGDIELTADENMIRSTIRNLISNAIKFTPQNGRVGITAEKTGSQVIFSVSDNGIGMSEAILSGLFSIETATSVPGTDKEKGTGLGLILCKEFVEKHGGTIRAESKPGEGSTFTFSIPAIQSES
jgi:signal transduction histidine kinase